MDRTVYFGVCGAGLGHAGRSVAVARELKTRGIRSVFSTYGPAVQYLRREGFETFDSPTMMWQERPDGGINWNGTILRWPAYARTFLQQVKLEEKRIRELRPDAVVSDSRYSTWAGLKQTGIPDVFLTNQPRILMPDPNNPVQRIMDKGNQIVMGKTRRVLIPDFPAPYSIGRANYFFTRRTKQKVVFTGPMVHTPPEAVGDRTTIRRELGIPDDEPFVYAALSGPGVSRTAIIGIVQKAMEELRFHSYMSMGKPPDTRIESVGPFDRSQWADMRYRLMLACDLLIARPGLSTISEAIRYGKPMVLIPTPDQTEQEQNAATIERFGLGRSLPQREVSARALRKAVEELADDETTRLRVTRYRELATLHDGARAAADVVTGLIEGDE